MFKSQNHRRMLTHKVSSYWGAGAPHRTRNTKSLTTQKSKHDPGNMLMAQYSLYSWRSRREFGGTFGGVWKSGAMKLYYIPSFLPLLRLYISIKRGSIDLHQSVHIHTTHIHQHKKGRQNLFGYYPHRNGCYPRQVVVDRM